MSPELIALLDQIRAHPLLPQLLNAVEPPRLAVFKPSQASDAEAAKAKWIYQSGQRNQHEKWIAFLTGKQILPEDRTE